MSLPLAAVERGAKAWLRHCSQPGWQSREAAIRREAFAREGVKQVLTAALRLDDPETVERVAKWLEERDYREFNYGSGPDECQRAARTLIALLLGAEPEEAEDAD